MANQARKQAATAAQAAPAATPAAQAAPVPTPAAAPAPVAATAPATPAQAATTKPAPKGSVLGGCVLLPLGKPTTAHGAAIAAAAAQYAQGPAGAQALGAPLAYVTGACSYLACAGLGYNPKAGKKAGAAGVWYDPSAGVCYAATGAPMVHGQPGAHNDYTVAAVAPMWAQIVAAVQAYHAAKGGNLPAWATPAAPQVEAK